MNKRILCIIASAVFLLTGTACSVLPTSGTKQFVYDKSSAVKMGVKDEEAFIKKFESAGFTLKQKRENTVAACFTIYDYEKYGYTVHLLVIDGNQNYLIYPSGFSTDEIIKEFGNDLPVIKEGTGSIYLAATACGADFRAINAIENIRFSSIRPDDWYIDEIKRAMDSGSISFAGKYSAPDYEQLTDKKASLAIESTMILHTPAVREKLIRLGIPVLTDYSSYESSAEARMEWVKVYGLITGHEGQAQRFFRKKYKAIRKVDSLPKTGKKTVYFSLDAEGNAVVRSSTDYIPEMIRAAGGEYAFPDLTNPNKDSHSASVNITFEEFYNTAKDADVLILNTTIEGSIRSTQDLTDENRLFSDFRAVQNGEVYQTSASLYQSVDKSDEIIKDMHRIFTGRTPHEFFSRIS